MTKVQRDNRRKWLLELGVRANFTSVIAAKKWGVCPTAARSRLAELHKAGWLCEVSRIKWPVPLHVVWRLSAKGVTVV